MNRRNFWRGFWGLFLLAIGLLWILDNFNVIHFDFGDALALLFPMLLIAVGLLLLLRHRSGVSSSNLTDKSIFRAFGEVKLSGENLDANGLEATVIFGNVELDLTRAHFTEGENAVDFQTVFGEVKIKVPENIAVSASGSSGFGSLRILGKTEDGVGNRLSSADPNFESQTRRLRIHASTVFGDIIVSRG